MNFATVLSLSFIGKLLFVKVYLIRLTTRWKISKSDEKWLYYSCLGSLLTCTFEVYTFACIGFLMYTAVWNLFEVSWPQCIERLSLLNLALVYEPFHSSRLQQKYHQRVLQRGWVRGPGFPQKCYSRYYTFRTGGCWSEPDSDTDTILDTDISIYLSERITCDAE